MALPLAIRPRIRLHDEPERPRAARVSPVVGQVAAYWAVMGALIYAVSQGKLPLDRWLDARAGSVAELARSLPAPLEPETAPAAPPEPPSAPPEAPLAVAAPPRFEVPEDDSREASEPVERREARPSPWATGTRSFALYPDDAPASPPPEEAERAAIPEPGETETRVARTSEPEPPVRTARDTDVAAPARTTRDTGAEKSTRTARSARPEPRAERPLAPPPDPFAPAPREPREPRGDATRAATAPIPMDPNWLFPEDPSLEPRRRGGADRAPEGPLPAPETLPRPAKVTTCEAAILAARQEIDMTAGRGPADLTRDAYARILENGAWLAGCGVPATTSVDVCAAVQNGHAVGVTVTTKPADARVAACVRNRVASLRFPSNPRLDVTRTRFGTTKR